jgi:hypothetical protein
MSIYNQLADANEIRLLYLHCGRKGEPIECTIKHHLFSSELAYEALSYEWGKSDQDLAPIQLDHNTHHVRKNLWQALHHLRSEEQPRIFWVDALCINQRDVKERNHQVSQMGKIYEGATNVVVWLGRSGRMSSQAVKFLLETGVGKQADTRYKMFCQGHTRTLIAKDTLEAVSALCQRSYWSRLWIIQEIVLAKSISLHLGDDCCNWLDLAFFIRQLEERVVVRAVGQEENQPNEILIMQAMLERIQRSVPARLIHERDEIKSKILTPNDSSAGIGFRPLLDIFSEYQRTECADRRDKVFGLRTFAPRCCKEAVPVDYSLSMTEIVGQLCQHHLDAHSVLGTKRSVGKESTISESQSLHQKLAIASTDCEKSFPWAVTGELLSKFSPDMHVAQSAIRGRISWVSAPLSAKEAANSFRERSLPAPIIRQIQYINSLRTVNSTLHPNITHELDLISSVRTRSKHELKPGFDKRSASDEFETSRGRIFRYALRLLSDSDIVQDSATRILVDAVAAVAASSTATGNCRLAFEERGLILFVPDETKRGDLVCQSEGSNILLLVRVDWKNNEACRLLGRGVNFLASSSATTPDICGLSMGPRRYYRRRPQRHTVTFRLDYPTLRMMTCVSVTPDQRENMPMMPRSFWRW